VEVSASGGGFAKSTKEYLHRFYANFEHEIGSGGEVVKIVEVFSLFLRRKIYHKSSIIKYFVFIYIFYFRADHISYFENLQTFSCVIFYYASGRYPL
jgi:hypothetical protein